MKNLFNRPDRGVVVVDMDDIATITNDTGSPRGAGEGALRCSTVRFVVSVAVVVVAADQFTKWLAGTVRCGRLVCSVENDQLMVGVGGEPPIGSLLFGVVGLVVFALWVRFMQRRVVFSSVAVGLVTGGIVANIVDRLVLGSVRDFLVVPFGIVMNLADVAIFVGLCACVGRAVRVPFWTSRGGEET